jgi:hypothetical protein
MKNYYKPVRAALPLRGHHVIQVDLLNTQTTYFQRYAMNE